MSEEDEQKRRFEQMENLIRKHRELQRKLKERKSCEICKTTLDDSNFYGSIIYDDLIFPSVCRACAEEFIEIKLAKISMEVRMTKRAIISMKMYHRRRDKLLYTITGGFIKELKNFSWLYKVHIVNPLSINFFKYLEDYYEDSNNPNAVIQLEKSIQQAVKQYPEKTEFFKKIFASPEKILKKTYLKEFLVFCEKYNIDNKIKTPRWVLKGESQPLTDDIINYLHDKLQNITFHSKFKKLREAFNP